MFVWKYIRDLCSTGWPYFSGNPLNPALRCSNAFFQFQWTLPWAAWLFFLAGWSLIFLGQCRGKGRAGSDEGFPCPPCPALIGCHLHMICNYILCYWASLRAVMLSLEVHQIFHCSFDYPGIWFREGISNLILVHCLIGTLLTSILLQLTHCITDRFC